jgi:uncharacterized repeat protein (TIGR03803 family)
LTPPKSPGGAWTEAVLYTFTGKGDGAQPNGIALNPGGVLYGTTQVDGIASCLNGQGCGTVFSLTPPSAPGGSWTLDTIYQFGSSPDAAHPEAAVLIDGGVLYGSTGQGGQLGFGTVFSLAPPAAPGVQTYSVGSRKMLISSAAIRPPTITMANGRCESEPMPCEGRRQQPSVATSMVIMMGEAQHRAFHAASRP